MEVVAAAAAHAGGRRSSVASGGPSNPRPSALPVVEAPNASTEAAGVEDARVRMWETRADVVDYVVSHVSEWPHFTADDATSPAGVFRK